MTYTLRVVFVAGSILAACIESGVVVVLFRRTILTRVQLMFGQVGAVSTGRTAVLRYYGRAGQVSTPATQP
jgi:hypothetical protein